MRSIEAHADRMRTQYARKRRHAEVNQGLSQVNRDSQRLPKDAVYKNKYEYYKKKYHELKLRYEMLSTDAKNKESAFVKDLKELENKSREDTNFFDNSMDELKKRHEEEIKKVSERVVR